MFPVEEMNAEWEHDAVVRSELQTKKKSRLLTYGHCEGFRRENFAGQWN